MSDQALFPMGDLFPSPEEEEMVIVEEAMKEKEEGRPDYNRAKMDPAESQADQRVD
jgi:hypothetical protein